MAVGVTETSELAFAGTTACHELLAAEFLARACQICLCIEYLQNVLVPVVGGYPLQSSSRAAKVMTTSNAAKALELGSARYCFVPNGTHVLCSEPPFYRASLDPPR